MKKVNIPTSTTSLASYAFQSTALKEINIPNTVTSIGTYTFNGCRCATEVHIPTSITQIGQCVFQNCISLSAVIVPSNVATIGANAFNGCAGVLEYHFQKTSPPTLSNISAFNQIRSDCKMYVPYSSDGSILNAYKTANNWSNFATYMLEEPQ